MRDECVSADEGAVRVRDVEGGHGWRFGRVGRDGRRDIESYGVEEDADGRRPASFIAVAAAFVSASREARQRRPIDR